MLEHAAGRFLALGVLQPLPQHTVQAQRQKAHQRVRADAPGQPVDHRSDLDIALERAEPAL